MSMVPFQFSILSDRQFLEFVGLNVAEAGAAGLAIEIQGNKYLDLVCISFEDIRIFSFQCSLE